MVQKECTLTACLSQTLPNIKPLILSYQWQVNYHKVCVCAVVYQPRLITMRTVTYRIKRPGSVLWRQSKITHCLIRSDQNLEHLESSHNLTYLIPKRPTYVCGIFICTFYYIKCSLRGAKDIYYICMQTFRVTITRGWLFFITCAWEASHI